MQKVIILPLVALTALVLTACNSGNDAVKIELGEEKRVAEVIQIDGSSTVYPITEAVAEDFQKMNRDAKVTVGISGTGGGFKKFCRGEIDISDASRSIKADEMTLCEQTRIKFIELPVAYDGLAVVVNPQNDWAAKMTVEELKMIWSPEAQGKILKWNQIRPEWPAENIHLYGPGAESGTFDYFTEAVVGKSKSSRGDFTASEDDNILVQGIASDKYALGYFGLAYYLENKDKLQLVAVNGVLPSEETVKNATYQPLSRPLFIYVSTASLQKQEVLDFIEYYLDQASVLAGDVGYVSFNDNILQKVQQRFKNRKEGTMYSAEGDSQVNLEELLNR